MKSIEQTLRRKHCSQDRMKCVEPILLRTCNAIVKFVLHLITFERFSEKRNCFLSKKNTTYVARRPIMYKSGFVNIFEWSKEFYFYCFSFYKSKIIKYPCTARSFYGEMFFLAHVRYSITVSLLRTLQEKNTKRVRYGRISPSNLTQFTKV